MSSGFKIGVKQAIAIKNGFLGPPDSGFTNAVDTLSELVVACDEVVDGIKEMLDVELQTMNLEISKITVRQSKQSTTRRQMPRAHAV